MRKVSDINLAQFGDILAPIGDIYIFIRTS